MSEITFKFIPTQPFDWTSGHIKPQSQFYDRINNKYFKIVDGVVYEWVQEYDHRLSIEPTIEYWGVSLTNLIDLQNDQIYIRKIPTDTSMLTKDVLIHLLHVKHQYPLNNFRQVAKNQLNEVVIQDIRTKRYFVWEYGTDVVYEVSQVPVVTYTYKKADNYE